MEEFKQISRAPIYEISKKGAIRKIDKKTPIFPTPLGSNTVKLDTESGRQTFGITELVSEVWEGHSPYPQPMVPLSDLDHATCVSPENSHCSEKIITVDVDECVGEELVAELTKLEQQAEESKEAIKSGKAKKFKTEKEIKKAIKKKEKHEKEEKRSENIKPTPEINRINKLKCLLSIKIWKMHQLGFSDKDIRTFIGKPYIIVKLVTDRYKKSKKLRDRADQIK